MKYLLLIIFSIILFSCSVQKRKYQQGFYISGHTNQKKIIKDESIDTNKNNDTKINEIKAAIKSIPENNSELIASTTKELVLLNQPIKKNKTKFINDSCDMITLRNGVEIEGKVLEISTTEIKYKKCNLIDGPIFIEKRSDVFMIKYRNGTKEVFKTEEAVITLNNNNSGNNNNNGINNQNRPKKTNGLAIVSLICALLGFVTFGIGWILGVTFGKIALAQIKENPGYYNGKGIALAGLIISLVAIALILFIILVALLLI